MNDDVQWTVFGGLPIAEPSEDEINHWRKLTAAMVNLDEQIEDTLMQIRALEYRLEDMRGVRASIAHILDCGPNNGALAKLREAKE